MNQGIREQERARHLLDTLADLKPVTESLFCCKQRMAFRSESAPVCARRYLNILNEGAEPLRPSLDILVDSTYRIPSRCLSTRNRMSIHTLKTSAAVIAGRERHQSPMNLIKSKTRVADHGEVFTPQWLVEAMLDLVKGETERIDSRFLEPACGSGNFLVPVLQRKLAAVEAKFGKSDFERRHYALLAVMCAYGIELLADNIAECRANMLEALADYLNLNETDDLYRAALYVLSQNIVNGDALTMLRHDGQPLTFAEWGYLGKGKFQRRDFGLDALTQMSSYSQEGSLFSHLGKNEVFKPLKEYPPMTTRELASLPLDDELEASI